MIVKRFDKQKYSTNLSAKIVYNQKQNCYDINITANDFARAVFVDCPASGDVLFSDNYFCMEKGEQKTVTLSAFTGVDVTSVVSPKDVTIKTIADEWND